MFRVAGARLPFRGSAHDLKNTTCQPWVMPISSDEPELIEAADSIERPRWQPAMPDQLRIRHIRAQSPLRWPVFQSEPCGPILVKVSELHRHLFLRLSLFFLHDRPARVIEVDAYRVNLAGLEYDDLARFGSLDHLFFQYPPPRIIHPLRVWHQRQRAAAGQINDCGVIGAS